MVINKKIIGQLLISLILLSLSGDDYVIPEDYPVTNEMLEKIA